MYSKFPSKLYLWGTNVGELSPPGQIKIAMACLRIILRNEYQTVGNILFASFKSDVKPIQLKILEIQINIFEKSVKFWKY